MKPWIALLCLLAGALGARANPPVVVYRPAPVSPVVSPLTPPVTSANQSLLDQINRTLAQRRTEHEILTTNALLRAPRPAISPARVAR